MRKHLAAITAAILGLALLGFAPGARAADPTTHAIAPSLTDAAITDPPPPAPPRGDNLVWLASDPDRRVNKLLVFLPTGGPTNLPSEFTEFGSVAGRLGYHTIILAYRNEAPVAATPPAGCGSAAVRLPSAPNCARDARAEILDGLGESTVVNVDEANSIYNRLSKLLMYLDQHFPTEGWSQFLDAGGVEPEWSKTVIAGSSLGAGQAAMIAQRHDVDRAALLHGWVDAGHGWVTLGATPPEDYFTLIHARDNFYQRTCFAYAALELTAPCPPNGFPIAVLPTDGFPIPVSPSDPMLLENREPPYASRMHVFNIEPGSFAGMGDWYHQSTSRDGWIARVDGKPSPILVNAWRSILGDSDSDTYLDDFDNCRLVANPELNADGKQFDADGDLIGDACDATPQGTTPPVIVVPGHITVNATGPAGATVSYTVTATDDLDPNPSSRARRPWAGSRSATPRSCAPPPTARATRGARASSSRCPVPSSNSRS